MSGTLLVLPTRRTHRTNRPRPRVYAYSCHLCPTRVHAHSPVERNNHLLCPPCALSAAGGPATVEQLIMYPSADTLLRRAAAAAILAQADQVATDDPTPVPLFAVTIDDLRVAPDLDPADDVLSTMVAETLGPHLYAVLASLTQKAVEGSNAHQRLFLQLVGLVPMGSTYRPSGGPSPNGDTDPDA